MTVTAAGFEPGTLVRARGREWVVLPESEPELLVLRPLGGSDDERAAVLPDLEDVASATFAYPDPSDAGNASRAALLRTALRIGFRSTGGPFRSLGGLAVEPRPYQLVPLLMALRQDTVRLLIADDVGIGKTVESGLIAAELLAQGDANGLAVLCSPALAEQWQRELAEKFGVAAELVLPGTVRRLERDLVGAQSIFDRYRHVVVSTDYIKRPELRDQFVRGAPDLVIVDEAHSCVLDDSNSGGRSRMQRHELVRRLAARADRHLILVTATPHSGKDAGFRNLVGLLDPRLETVDLDRVEGRELLARHFVQRRRVDIRGFLEDTPFPEDRDSTERAYRLTGDYRGLFDDVVAYARQTVRDPIGGQVRQRVRYWSALALLRALASSPQAAAATLRTRAANADAADAAEADALGRAAVLDLPDDETQESVDLVPGADTEDSGGPERRRLLAFARRAEALAAKGDAKLDLLVKEVKALLGDGFNPVVFCRYIDTAEYVADRLTAALGKAFTVGCVTGALPPEERTERIRELTGDPKRRPVLVATDCLSEGVNLQEHFQAVVHYDLAWNPTRHEQREGRVDRFGQRAPRVRAVMIYGTDNRIDEIVLKVLLRKHEQIRKALGVSVPVPDRSDDVLQTIAQELLLAPDTPEQLTIEGLGVAHREELHREWDSAAQRENKSRTKYAQRTIAAQLEAVKPELAEIRASLGSPEEVAEFARAGFAALGADVVPNGDGFDATTGMLPLPLRDAFPAGYPATLALRRELPTPARTAHLDRTDPYVSALARYLLESALDRTVPADQRPARRAGVMRTSAVAKRTTLLLVRFRLHLTLPTRAADAEPRRMVAEEARLLAFRGAPTAAEWLPDGEVAALLSATPTGNVLPEAATPLLERVIGKLDEVVPHLDATADGLADGLRSSHIRVREAVGQRVRRQITVTAQKPADVLGVYVYLPEAAA
ncbi:helicase-related protein [Micromonospora sp. WMMD998]|uniref:helicase-related protein n=1 Tax=Micromonospora sp. WMMD998 TaxID=3016092 RepID=UPI00249B185A|nr:helicase-related protein [Micromonospora sp. WMMD998]WFE41505.1 helicase-related protein [Micromonospora sp. WMMD998]